MKKIVSIVLSLAVAFSSAFAGTYKNETLDSDFGQWVVFNEMHMPSCKGSYEVTDELWGGFGNNLVAIALDCNKDFKTGLITNYRKIDGTDDSITVVEIKNGKVVKAIIYMF